jgi:hypothetical protein
LPPLVPISAITPVPLFSEAKNIYAGNNKHLRKTNPVYAGICTYFTCIWGVLLFVQQMIFFAIQSPIVDYAVERRDILSRIPFPGEKYENFYLEAE